jgi:hypothetical protein
MKVRVHAHLRATIRHWFPFPKMKPGVAPPLTLIEINLEVIASSRRTIPPEKPRQPKPSAVNVQNPQPHLASFGGSCGGLRSSTSIIRARCCMMHMRWCPCRNPHHVQREWQPFGFGRLVHMGNLRLIFFKVVFFSDRFAHPFSAADSNHTLEWIRRGWERRCARKNALSQFRDAHFDPWIP